VEYIDNSVIGEFSVPDMRSCVQYAVDYPVRDAAVTAELDLVKIGALTFSEVDTEAFPLISLASEAYMQGGAMCAVMNAADEIAADAFLREKIGFNDISDIVSSVCAQLAYRKNGSSIEYILEADKEARELALRLVEAIRRK
jgi:1-deoxy-D-xylulose-5-phosphate reductoisomerase